MRLTIDLDGVTDPSVLDEVRDRPQLDGSNPWQIRQSSSGNGLHYIEWDAASTWDAVMDLREQFGDDDKRRRLDRVRHLYGSPFLQVLYDVKYMDRWGWEPESGNQKQVLDGTSFVPVGERIKSPDGTLRYPQIAANLVEQVYGSQRELADSLDMARSTVSGWLSGAHQPSAGARKKLKRRARHHGLGHYVEGADKAAGRMGLDVQYVEPDDKDLRRTIVEYADAPWDWDIGGDDREYALLNVHTGTFNDEHSEGQLKYVHDSVMEHVLEVLSPSNPETGQQLNLDRETRHPINREQDSVNYERALLDPDEARYYRGHMVSSTGATRQGIDVSDVESQIIFEVILWDGNMDGMHWHVLGVWAGDSVSDAVVVHERVDGGGSWW